MIVVGMPKQGTTKKVYCPLCGSRLCDKVIDNSDDKITVSDDCDSNFIMKCHKCGQQIGIALVFSA